MSKEFQLDGKTLTPEEFILALRAKYGYTGLVPAMVINVKGKPGMAGSRLPEPGTVPTEKEYQMLMRAIKEAKELPPVPAFHRGA